MLRPNPLIQQLVDKVREASDNGDDKMPFELMQLITLALSDLNRCADALERLADEDATRKDAIRSIIDGASSE